MPRRRNASTSTGSNCVPAPASSSRLASCTRHRVAVRAVGEHGVVGVGDGEHARDERDALAGEAVRVAGAVPALVVVAQDRGDARQSGALGELRARVRMSLDGVVLAGLEPARLEQDRARHDDLADVVQQAGERRLRDAAAVEPGRVGQLDRDARDARRMLGVGRDLRVEPASQLEQAREVDALATVHRRMIDQVYARFASLARVSCRRKLPESRPEPRTQNSPTVRP